MATATSISQVLQNHNNGDKLNINNIHEVSREDIQAAIAKAVELRAIHASLMQGNKNSPASNIYPFPSPASPPVSQFSAHDYPVFTPSYEDVPVPGYNHVKMENGPLSRTWDCCGLNEEDNSSKKGLPSGLLTLNSYISPSEDQNSVNGSYTNTITVLQTSPKPDFFKSSRRRSLGDVNDHASINKKVSKIVYPVTDSHSSVKNSPKNMGINLAWLFPRFKKKSKIKSSPARTESEEISQLSKNLGIMSVESLKKELMEANESRDSALMEVSEMKASMGDVKQKLEYLENYCEDLKKALTQAAQIQEKPTKINRNSENSLPVSEEVMVEGFLQIVSETRLSVKHFCKILIGQIEEHDEALMENLNTLLQPHKISLNSKYSKAVLYHLESIINQQIYQDFENCIFQKNGTPKFLDPNQDREAQFSSFVALRNLSWNEVLRKGTKYYSEEFSKFCDQKMSCIISTLNWTRPWPEQLLQAFFVAAKCIWLLHLLAFSFNPSIGILRVEENRSFDSSYMEDVFMDRQRSQVGPSRVKIMVMPGFYVLDKVLKCKVVCRYKSVEK